MCLLQQQRRFDRARGLCRNGSVLLVRAFLRSNSTRPGAAASAESEENRSTALMISYNFISKTRCLAQRIHSFAPFGSHVRKNVDALAPMSRIALANHKELKFNHTNENRN